MKKIALKNAARGTAFDYAGQSWILLENDDGRALCLSKDIIENRAFDEGNCNNFAVASSKEYLNGAYLDNLLEDVNGPNAFLTTELDLATDDGLKDYGACTVTIFLLTVDQYRRNRDVIPNADDWWWLSTAFSTKSNGYESLARVVSAGGTLDRDFAYYGDHGLRPACYLDSDLLISVEDDEATDDVTPEHAGEIIAALAEQYGAVQILQRARDDLGSRGRLAVDQHDDGHPRIDRVGLRRERLVEFADTAFHRHDFGSFGNQQGENLDGLLQYASAVASQIDDQRRGALLLELDERAAHVEAALFREIVVQDVSDPVGDHAVIGNARYLDALAP